MIKKVLRVFPVATAIVVTLLLGSCDSGTPGGGGTGQQVPVLAIGPISGFGSVIVNGIKYNDTAAVLRNELGNVITPSELRLGMMVEVRGASNSSGGIADSITAFSELKGIVESADGNSITVSGVQVSLVSTTIYYEATNLVIGDQVEVYGVYDASRGAVIATRVERKSLDDYKMRGTVSGLDTNTEQFSLGGRRISYTGSELPANFGNGISVRVYANTAPDGGVWPVTRIRLAGVGSSGSDSGDRVEVEGVISQLDNSQLFVVNGFEIDASGAAIFDGAAGDLAVGRRVEVKGTLSGDRLIAASIEFEDTSSSTGGGEDTSFEVTGTINRFASISDFTVRNVIIDASQTTRFDNGSVVDLAVGACIEVRGGLADNSINTVLLASRIKFEDDC